MFGFRNWRRRRVLRRAKLSDALWSACFRQVAAVQGLSAEERTRLRDLAVLFLHEKDLVGAAGLELDETMRLVIAIQACLPILNLGLDYYDGWYSVVVYPGGFRAPREFRDAAGVVHQAHQDLMGEAWHAGPLVLGWEGVSTGGAWLNGHNVVFHECAHKLDMLNGDSNGMPPLHPEMAPGDWSMAFGPAYLRFCERVDNGEITDIDPYAATNPGEFFAVISEEFFERPQMVKEVFPAVYRQLTAFYRQDPASRH